MNAGKNAISSSAVGRRDPLRSRLDREGAVALGLRRLHRQIAHELRGPLNSISLHTALLGRAARGDLAGIDDARAKQTGWVRAIEEDLARMTAGLDRWSDLLPGGGEVPERLDLCATLRALRPALAPLATRLRLDFEIGLPAGQVHVEGARRELIRLLASLAGASMEALGGGARLRLELTTGGGRATIETLAEPGGEEAPEEASLVSDMIPVLTGAFEAMGGALEPAGRAGWRAGWPLCGLESEEERG